MNVYISDHARQRIKERCGNEKKSTAERLSSLALERGIKAEETSGDAKRWLESHKRSEDHELYIYGDKIYIYSISRDAAVLITVIHLPQEIRKLLSRNKGKKSKYKS